MVSKDDHWRFSCCCREDKKNKPRVAKYRCCIPGVRRRAGAPEGPVGRRI